jgi:acyl transferase domain-containing protein
MMNCLDEVVAAVDTVSPDIRLARTLYPAAAFSPEQAQAQAEELRDTRRAQPALAAISAGMLAVLKRFNIVPDLVCGHSFGELTALYAGGVYDLRTLARLAAERGRLMSEASVRSGVATGMMAVTATAEKLGSLLRDSGLDIVIANHNAPEQQVLAGPVAELEKFATQLKDLGIRGKMLNVSAAFHSRFVADAVEPFHAVMEQMPFNEPQLTVYSNSTAAPYIRDVAQIKRQLAAGLAEPVLFVKELAAMREAGAEVFVEVGPSAHLAGLATQLLGRNSAAAVYALDGGAREVEGAGLQQLAAVLAGLAAQGFEVNLAAWDDNAGQAAAQPQQAGKADKLTIMLTGANYVAPRKRDHENPQKTPVPVSPQPAGAVTETRMTPHEAGMDHFSSSNKGSSMQESKDDHEMDVQMNAHHLGAPALSKAPPASPEAWQQLMNSFERSQQSLLILQKMQQDNAEIHRKFLEGQIESQKQFFELIQKQQLIMTSLKQSVMDSSGNSLSCRECPP